MNSDEFIKLLKDSYIAKHSTFHADCYDACIDLLSNNMMNQSHTYYEYIKRCNAVFKYAMNQLKDQLTWNENAFMITMLAQAYMASVKQDDWSLYIKTVKLFGGKTLSPFIRYAKSGYEQYVYKLLECNEISIKELVNNDKQF